MSALQADKLQSNIVDRNGLQICHCEEAGGRRGNLGKAPERCFKTLVTVGKTGGHYVFMIPVAAELDLRKAASAAGEKSVAMLPQKELLPLTGYIHGGCSPIGMKKQFPTFADATIADGETVCFSGGRVGLQIETTLAVLQSVVPVTLADLTV